MGQVRPDASMPLADIAEALGCPAPFAIDVHGISLDSRSVRPGDLYAALPGHVTHGARFAAQAVAAGAAAIVTDPAGAALAGGVAVPVLVVEEPRMRIAQLAAKIYGNPAADLQILGITGTNGKTTVATMVDSGLRSAGRTTGLIGTVGTVIAGERLPGGRTTPEATDLHALLGVMRDRNVATVAMEVSSIAMDEHRVDGVHFAVVAFTNLSQDHLDYHGTMKEYFRSKARLFEAERSTFGVIGVDDEWGRRLADECAIPHVTWSLLDPHADWHVERSTLGTIALGPNDERIPLDVHMPGSFNVANALCALAVLLNSGVNPAEAAAGIANASVPGRMQIAGVGAGIRGIVDYAHSPDAVERVLRAARDSAEGRVITVLGAGGDRDRAKRPLMGRVAARLSDLLMITDDNPRNEDPARIRGELRAGALEAPPGERAEVHEEGDRARAITVAVAMARPGDMVMVLGKGHEQGQEVAGTVHPFDDLSVLRAALDARSSM